MSKVKLTKIHSTHSNLRTNEVIGEEYRPPKVGSYFRMTASPIESKAAYREVTTSLIQSITPITNSILRFKTLNSEYELEYLD